MIELKQSDMNLLTYLYHNNREPFTKIAKATSLSREQVEYKIKKYQSLGLIKKFATFFNYGALGYNYLVVLIIKFTKHKYSEDFYKKLDKDKHCISKGLVLNKYDLFLNLIFKDEEEFRNYISKILNENKNTISDYFILKPFFAELYPLKFLQNKKGDDFIITPATNKISLNEKDMQILKILEKDGRVKITDIAHSLDISAELALYKLRKLYEKNIILGSRILFDMEKLGYFFSIIMLNIKNLSSENQAKIKAFAKQSSHVNSLLMTMSKPNCFVQVFHKEEQELREQIKKIKKLFEDEIIDLDVLFTEGEKEANTLPFL